MDECPGTRSDSSNCTTRPSYGLRINSRETEPVTCCYTNLHFICSRSTASSRTISFVPLTHAHTNAHAAASRSRELCALRLVNATIAIGSIEAETVLAPLSKASGTALPVCSK
ncbi:hypothetical protein TRVL_07227 [Trypanosoma vivax]|nr:hypothetical protein TRVL_07227 [Trypanosoma vivax]